jgi:hypothetical protein
MTCQIIPDPPPLPPPPPEIITTPSVNYNNVADWNNQDGNVTTIGTNGPPSFYNTYDQNGNVWEWTDQSDGVSNKICKGGAYDSELSQLDKCYNLSLSNTTRNSNTGFRLSRDIQNSEDSDDNIIYYLGMQSYTSNKEIYDTVIGGFKVNLDGSIQEEKRIYYNKISTSSGDTPISGDGLTRARLVHLNKGAPKGSPFIYQAYSPKFIIPISDNINILYTNALTDTGNPTSPDTWYAIDGRTYIVSMSMGIETIQYSTGKKIGSFTIDYPQPSDFISNTEQLPYTVDVLYIQSADSDGFYITITFVASNTELQRQFSLGDPSAEALLKNNISCVIVVDPSNGAMVSKNFSVTQSDTVQFIGSGWYRKQINADFLSSRSGLDIRSNTLPKNNGFFRSLSTDVFLHNKNYELLTDTYIDTYAFFRDVGSLTELEPGDIAPGQTSPVRNPTYYWGDGILTNNPLSVFSWAFDGNYLYGSINNTPRTDLTETPFDLVFPSFGGFVIAELSSMSILTPPTVIVPTFLKDQSNYLTYLSALSVSEDYSKRSDIRPVIFSVWSRVGDADNIADTCNSSSVGSVSEAFFMQKYAMTNSEYVSFLNVVAKQSDSYNLWIEDMENDPRGGIIRTGEPSNYTYTTKPNMTYKPVNFVNWFNAARFANWLHNRNFDTYSTDTETGAYTLNGAMSGNISVNNNAIFRIPSADEWHKAAFYDHSILGYYKYATKSSDDPTPVCADTTGNGKVCP